MRTIADGMLRADTPLEDYREQYGLWVKREDLSCPPPGPPFSKTRGVYAHVKSRPEELIGVLDTYHSQAGHAVARACQILGKKCINFYPEFKYEPGPRPPQMLAGSLGARLRGLKAGRSAILFHQARKETEARGGYMMPNALKLQESVDETAKETPEQIFANVLIPASSGTIAAGVICGFVFGPYFGEVECPKFIIHLGYSRSKDQVRKYLSEKTQIDLEHIETITEIVDEGYSYKDKSKQGETPPWPCNPYYDLKAFRWWLTYGNEYPGETLFWNIG